MLIDINSINWREFPLLQDADEEAVRTLFSVGFHFRYEVDSQIVCNRDAGDTFFLILNGLAKLVLVNSEQEAIGITLFRAGDFFGELSILGPEATRSGNIIAISTVNVLAIQKKEFLQIMESHPKLALNLARELGQRLRVMNDRMTTDRLPEDLHRVAHTLISLVKKGKVFDDAGPVLMPPLTLKEWSFFCYTSQQKFMESIELLKQAGAIQWQNQRIVISNLDALKHCATVHQSRLEDTRLLKVV